MQASLIDTDILSMFFRGHQPVVRQFAQYLTQHTTITLSFITYYEIVSGLTYRDAQRQHQSFLQFSANNTILPLTTQAVDIAAQHYASTMGRK